LSLAVRRDEVDEAVRFTLFVSSGGIACGFWI